MRTKKEILKEAKDSALVAFGEWHLEVLIDIRDALVEINEKGLDVFEQSKES